MKKSKYVSILVIVFILLLSACGKKSDTPNEKEESGVETIDFYTWIDETTGNWDHVIEKFEKEHPEIKVNKQILVDNASHADYLKQLDLIASSGSKIDVMMFSNPTDFAKRVDSGLIAPLDEYLQAENIQFEEEYDSPYAPIEGKYYGLPAKQVANLILLNKNHLDEAGLEIPKEWTWDDYREYAKKLTKGEGSDKHYGSFFFTWPDTYHVLKMLGKESNKLIVNENGESNVDDPILKDSIEFRYQLEQVDKTSVPLAETLASNLNYRQQFFTQEVSMIPSGSFLITQWGQFEPEFEIAWAPWPKNNANDPSYTTIGGDVVSVGSNSDKKEAAYTFARWLTTEGMVEQERFIPSWKNGDYTEILDKLIDGTSRPEAIHKESLQHTLDTMEPVVTPVPVPYISEAYDVFNTEIEMYLLGKQELDETMQKIQVKVDEVITNNQ